MKFLIYYLLQEILVEHPYAPPGKTFSNPPGDLPRYGYKMD